MEYTSCVCLRPQFWGLHDRSRSWCRTCRWDSANRFEEWTHTESHRFSSECELKSLEMFFWVGVQQDWGGGAVCCLTYLTNFSKHQLVGFHSQSAASIFTFKLFHTWQMSDGAFPAWSSQRLPKQSPCLLWLEAKAPWVTRFIAIFNI